jgi:hypothetical protein
MKKLISEYGMMLVSITIALILLGFFFGSFLTNDDKVGVGQVVPNISDYDKDTGDNSALDEINPQPILTLKSGTIDLNSTFNVNDFIIQASDEKGINLKNSSSIQYRGSVDTTHRGSYNIEVILTTDNFVLTKYTTIIVD